jgi:hypothetical protein
MRALSTNSILAALCAVVASAVFAASAYAQAGSTGGSLGQTDKSVSGEAPLPARPKPKLPARPKKVTVDAAPVVERSPAAVSLTGQWHWTANCRSGGWSGGFTLTQSPSGETSGVFTSESGGGTIDSGDVGAGRASFTRHYLLGAQRWVGQIGDGGRRLEGLIDGSCPWSASKL